MQLPPDTNESDGPNLTPVIDIVFLLLIFFLVATTYEREEIEESIDLPEIADALVEDRRLPAWSADDPTAVALAIEDLLAFLAARDA